MKSSRRKFLLASGFGAAQLALISKFGLPRLAHGAGLEGGPTKLLMLQVTGGLHWQQFFTPFADQWVENHIKGTAAAHYTANMVGNFDGSGDADSMDDVKRRIRGPIRWNWDTPQADAASAAEFGRHPETNQPYRPNGYAWAAPEYKLYEKTAVLHGVDQQTAAHTSGQIAGTCGIAGSNFAAPALSAVVANYFLDSHPDRVLPSVSITAGGLKFNAPAFNLNPIVNGKIVARSKDLELVFSDRPNFNRGLDTRISSTVSSFDGSTSGSIAMTAIERARLKRIKQLRKRSSSGTDKVLETLYENYRGLSKILAQDIVSTIENTAGVEYSTESKRWIPGRPPFGWKIGYADGGSSGATWDTEMDLALKFLKSDLVTSVGFRFGAPGQFNFDGHNSGGVSNHVENLIGVMESIGQLMIEMDLTPAPGKPGKTLLDDTLVYIYSDFGRTFHSDDHNPFTSGVFVGGGVVGNQMIGGFGERSTNSVPVEIRGEDGADELRPPKSQDMIATALDLYGMEANTDYFLPGGFGVVKGLREE